MELDKRIIEGKKPLDCFDVKEAKAFIGKECYLSNNMSCFGDLNCGIENKEIKKAELTRVSNTDPCYEIPGFYYDFCLPCEWVKEEKSELKYRPYSLNEFLELCAIGDVVTYRIKDCEVVEQSMLIGFQSSDDEDIPGDGYVLIGNCRYSLKELFNNYELNYQNEWQPFGVIEDE